jgi:hypothetical protein
MVVEHDRDGIAQAGCMLEDHLADPRVLTDRSPFGRGQPAGLVEDLGRDGDLAKVVQQARHSDPFDLLGGQLQLDREPGCQRGDHVRRTSAVVRLRGDDRGQRRRGGGACPLTDRRRSVAVFGRDRGTAHRRVLVHAAEQVGAVAAE